MEGVFHQNVSMKIIINSSISTHVITAESFDENDKFGGIKKNSTGYKRLTVNANKYYENFITEEVTELIKCAIKNVICYSKILFGGSVVQIIHNFINISMLKNFLSMEFDTDQIKSQSSDSSQAQSSANSKDSDENTQISNKKICSLSSLEENKFSRDSDASPESNRSSHGKAEPLKRYTQSGENAHVTQSRSIFSHKNSFVYGNPKEDIKNIENPPAGEVMAETLSLKISPPNVLDLSFKGGKLEEEKFDDGNTYQKYQRGSSYGNDSSFPRSNLEIKVVNPGNKKPSLPEQLQIAKMQQQQRRSMQQQQKLLQQMRRSLDAKASSNRQEASQSGPKNAKFYGNNSTNHEPNDVDNHGRVKDDFYTPIPGSHFPQLPYPYFDPSHLKELPDNHPILPLLDPVYFSALYNAHGFLPPSSPSIAAAFIGTLQDALPKLPMVFPSTSSNSSPLLSQKTNENPN